MDRTRDRDRKTSWENGRGRESEGGRDTASVCISHVPYPHFTSSHSSGVLVTSPLLSLPPTPSLPHSQLLKQKNFLPHPHQSVDDIIVPLDESLRSAASTLAARLRSKGRNVDLVLESKRLKWWVRNLRKARSWSRVDVAYHVSHGLQLYASQHVCGAVSWSWLFPLCMSPAGRLSKQSVCMHLAWLFSVWMSGSGEQWR